MRGGWLALRMFAAACVAMTAAVLVPSAAAQGTDPVWAGVYSSTQAERGKTTYQANCRTCHSFDLTGGRGPALTGDSFMTTWDAQSVNKLYDKIKSTMPQTRPSTLSDDAYMDIVAFILHENGFPEGKQALNEDVLDAAHIVKKSGSTTKKAVANFTLVELVGCLAKGSDNKWILVNSSEPVGSKDEPSTAGELKSAETAPLGNDSFLLVSVLPYKPDSHDGQKMVAKGLVYREPNSRSRLSLTSLQSVSSSCAN